MAEITGSITEIMRGVYSITWTFPSGTLACGDVGNAFDGVHLPDKSVEVRTPTTWLAAGTSNIVIEGNNSAASGPYFILTNPNNDNLSFASSQFEQILEITRFVRPRLNTVTTATSPVVVTLIAESGKR